jgi:hypothetical protein
VAFCAVRESVESGLSYLACREMESRRWERDELSLICGRLMKSIDSFRFERQKGQQLISLWLYCVICVTITIERKKHFNTSAVDIGLHIKK